MVRTSFPHREGISFNGGKLNSIAVKTSFPRKWGISFCSNSRRLLLRSSSISASKGERTRAGVFSWWWWIWSESSVKILGGRNGDFSLSLSLSSLSPLSPAINTLLSPPEKSPGKELRRFRRPRLMSSLGRKWSRLLPANLTSFRDEKIPPLSSLPFLTPESFLLSLLCVCPPPSGNDASSFSAQFSS